ncbi:MAG: TPM domain-containing protein [Chitinophagaceae bacterium]|nr:TPM domain-containing protein [Chitinophagaceae bacterium]MCW5929633.1 TPM domain-containing protein [Chitinophagaceae bacterium]
MKVSRVILLIFPVLFSIAAFGQKKWTIKEVPDPKSRPGWNYVSNPDSILNSSTVDNINMLLKDLEQQTTNQGAVAVLQSIGSKSPKEFATALLREWGVGQKEKNNGFLILLVLDQRRMEFEIGYGLEGILTDVTCKRIQEQYMVPHAKAGDYNATVLNGVSQVCRVLLTGNNTIDAGVPGEEVPRVTPDVPYSGPEPADYPASGGFSYLMGEVIPYLVSGFILFIVFLIFSSLSKRKAVGFSRKYETASFKILRFILVDLLYIGLFLFLAGDFGILKLITGFYGYILVRSVAATYFTKRWLKKEVAGRDREEVYKLTREAYLRWPGAFQYVLPFPFRQYFRSLMNAMTRLRNEPVYSADGAAMTKLNEAEDDAYLEKHQVKEEELQAVDYDVWHKPDSGEHTVFRYELFSKYSACPKCAAITYTKSGDKVLYAATYESAGKGLRTYTCQYCAFEKKEEYHIPKLERSSDSSGSGSSGSSGGSSWGGGSSGGGGAGSSW